MMKAKHHIERLKQEIEDTRRSIRELGDIHPGSISTQYHACGKASCRCHDPVNPKKHGPYNKLTYVHKGKNACRFVREECVEQLQKRLSNYKTLRRLIDRWIELSIQIGRLEFFARPPKAPRNQSKSRS
jgi:hypothetical protein